MQAQARSPAPIHGHARAGKLLDSLGLMPVAPGTLLYAGLTSTMLEEVDPGKLDAPRLLAWLVKNGERGAARALIATATMAPRVRTLILPVRSPESPFIFHSDCVTCTGGREYRGLRVIAWPMGPGEARKVWVDGRGVNFFMDFYGAFYTVTFKAGDDGNVHVDAEPGAPKEILEELGLLR